MLDEAVELLGFTEDMIVIGQVVTVGLMLAVVSAENKMLVINSGASPQ